MSQDWEKFLANGVSFTGGTPPQRKHFLDMLDEELFLYREGLRRFQSVDPKNNKSWYSICGIHGLPYTNWPDWNKVPSKAAESGFCTHSSILFLTWHRPYLALFESILYGHVGDAAKSIEDSEPNKQHYLNLAKNFRMPYWDWARKGVPIFPPQALNDTFDFKNPAFKVPKMKPTPAGQDTTYNPLFKAPIPENSPVKGPPNELDYNHTVRYPGAENPQEAQQKLLAALTKLFEKPGEVYKFLFKEVESNLTERVGYVLSAYQRYASVCSNRVPGTDEDDLKSRAEIYGSFEDFHNAVHWLTGGRGHMSWVPKSAFDPIFWLHHTNIDRLFAIWQALNDSSDKNAYVTTRPSGSDSYWLKEGQDEGIDTPLYPFRHTTTENGWHTSKTVKRTEDFGYTYPETAGLSYPPSQEQLAQLRTKVKNLYPIQAKSILESQKGLEDAGASLLPQAEILRVIHEKKLTASTEELVNIIPNIPNGDALLETSWGREKPRLKDLVSENSYLEWLVNLKAEKHSLGGSFSVHVFIGPVEDDVISLWPLSPHHVGSFAPLGQPTETNCEKCQQDQQNHLEVTGQIPLTIALTERWLAGLISDMEVETVKSYLQTNLHWRVVQSDGTILQDRSQVAGLLVFVASNKVTLPTNETDFPEFAQDVTIYPEITTNANGNPRGDGTGLTRDMLSA